MKILKESQRKNPKISLILVDWSVRESFHLLHYLSQQNIPRDDFEVIVIEYYSRVPEALKKFEDQIDTWILLEMPEEYYYHKHLMYNVGFIFSHGELVTICDFDSMVRPTFLESMIKTFKENKNIVLHLDQFRNNNRRLYPFCYPSFEEVVGEGCTNYLEGKTKGVATTRDPLHNRNYGTCFCARRKDLIAIGGADEHVGFVGHICGPYDLTFRLINFGRQEIWHQAEFLYHTWHPGQAGVGNYFGPHDGRHMSTIALEALISLRIFPQVMNTAILHQMKDPGVAFNTLMSEVINSEYKYFLPRKILKNRKVIGKITEENYREIIYKAYKILKKDQYYVAQPMIMSGRVASGIKSDETFQLKENSLSAVRKSIRKNEGKFVTLLLYLLGPFFGIFYLAMKFFHQMVSIPKRVVYIAKKAYALRFIVKEKVECFVRLLTNLFLLRRLRLRREICILTDNKIFFALLKFAGKFSSKKVNVVYISPKTSFDDILTHVDNGKLLFIPRVLYIRFGGKLHKRVKDLVVI